jgi:hypothetical protein
MPGSRHDPEVIMPLQPPIIDGGVPQVVEGKILNTSLPTG